MSAEDDAAASPAELSAAAERAPMLRWVRGLAAYAGAGLPVTSKGNLRLADGRRLVERLGTGDAVDPVLDGAVYRTKSTEQLSNLDYAFRLALAADVLRSDGRRVHASGASRLLEQEPVQAVAALWRAMVREVGPVRHQWRRGGADLRWYADAVDSRLLQWQVQMYDEPAGLDVRALTVETYVWIRDDHAEDLDPNGSPYGGGRYFPDVLADAVLGSFRRLEQLGLVQVDGEVSEETQAFAGAGRLTALGTWLLERDVVPEVGALAELDASELLARVVDLGADSALREVRHWVSCRPDDGLPLLVSAIPQASETGRDVALAVLLRLGTDALDAVEPLREHAGLAPYVTVLRASAGVATDSELVAPDPQAWIGLLGAVLRLHGGAAVARWAPRVAGEAGVLRMTENAWRVRLTSSLEVLDALAYADPDGVVAEAARTSSSKLRSATLG